MLGHQVSRVVETLASPDKACEFCICNNLSKTLLYLQFSSPAESMATLEHPEESRMRLLEEDPAVKALMFLACLATSATSMGFA